MKEKSFLGTGWSFPPTFLKESANIALVSDEEDIKQSLKIYFNLIHTHGIPNNKNTIILFYKSLTNKKKAT